MSVVASCPGCGLRQRVPRKALIESVGEHNLEQVVSQGCWCRGCAMAKWPQRIPASGWPEGNFVFPFGLGWIRAEVEGQPTEVVD